MSKYQELLAQRSALEQAIDKARKEELTAALNQARELVQKYELTAEDIFSADKVKKKVEPKYQDPETGMTWTGRGRKPLWIATAPDPDVYLIQKS